MLTPYILSLMYVYVEKLTKGDKDCETRATTVQTRAAIA